MSSRNISFHISPLKKIMYYCIHTFNVLPHTVFNTKKQHSHTHTHICVCNAGNVVSVPGSGRSPGGGCGNPLQYSCLENSMDGEAWQAILHRVANSWTQLKQLSMHTCTHTHTHTYIHTHTHTYIYIGKGNDYLPQYSCLENFMDSGA